MTHNLCPICSSGAELLGDRDYGDKCAYDCPRCGQFEISGTALEMLEGRLKGNPSEIARLSHALRMVPKKDGEPFMLLSTNVDSLIATPLPGVERQLDNLLKWIAARIGDDRLGITKLIGTNIIASFVGAVDGERVDRLIQFAVEEGFIETGNGREIALTLSGWRRLDSIEEAKSETVPLDQQVASNNDSGEGEIADKDKIVKANCNTCGGDRNSYQRRIYEKREDDGIVGWSNTIETLECCGCGELSIRREIWFSEWDEYGHDALTGEEILLPGVKTTHWPPASQRAKPDWIDRLDDETLRTVLDQVYIALNQGATILAVIGIRTLLDWAMFIRIGDPKRGFVGKIDAMIKAGKIASGEKSTFLTLVDVGSAAAHRGHDPDFQIFDKVLTATEAFLYREFILPIDAEAVRVATPARETNSDAGSQTGSENEEK